MLQQLFTYFKLKKRIDSGIGARNFSTNVNTVKVHTETRQRNYKPIQRIFHEITLFSTT